MAHGWTPERRKKQSEAILRWRPWDKSTGPKTAEGKTRSSMNAYTGAAEFQAVLKRARAYLRDQREALTRIR
ncbi:hypothetical protein IVG45_00670 [Methylomonas sp. LL1]|uniref:hypothetical protein n=1 Tax=Methylomonas sp. LL1 TaxID=2785785 RepID=UPI0018C3F35B|nr:hypothetical protein [Methylomonas sp. LL1]QPK63532.1 hypothetical protein IVG45_00670 [Methylomonas sp. LL1]